MAGLLIGLNMAIISIATEWASDLKQGHCSAGWWLNRKFCCWEMMDPAGPGGAAVPPPVAQASIATTAPAAASSTLLSNLTRAFERAPSIPISSSASYAQLHQAVSLLYPRAEHPSAGYSESCPDWVTWSTWTIPAWLVYLSFAAVFAASCAFLVRAFAPYAAGSGITEIKCVLAGFIIHGFLGFQTLVIKSLSLPLAIASGLSVGKEGPAVHVACCIGNVVSGFFKSFDHSQARMRELLTAASAAGVAVAFGSPIGGVLFSLEEMAYQFPATTMWRSFLCALAATVALSFMNPFRTGKLVLFQVSYDRDWHYFEMVFYLIIGIFGGLYGAFVIKYNLQVQAFRRNNLAAYGVSEAVVLAVLTASVGYWNKFLQIDMTESLEILFKECEGGGDYDNLCQSWAQWRMVNSLLIATVVRAILVVLSYGCKVPAGIFVPSMAIGATFGRMLGILVKAAHNAYPQAALFSTCEPDVPCVTPGTYAFLGAAAALAGVTRITVAVVVIMFELTGALTYILPTMIVVMVTKGIGDLWGKGGIAEQSMKLAGYPFLDKDEHNFGLIPVREVMKRAPDVLFAQGISLKDLEAMLDNTYRGFPVVRSYKDHTLLGYVGKAELRYAVNKARRARPSLSASAICYFSGCDEDEQYGVGNASTIGARAGSVQPSAMQQADSEAEMRAEQESSGQTALPSARRVLPENEGLMDEGERRRSQDQRPPRDSRSRTSEDSLSVELDSTGGVDGESDEDALDLTSWVDQSPLSVGGRMPLEVVMDLFKKMGPRVILVVDRQGSLQGLVTVKDLLKHIAAQEHAEALEKEAMSQSRESDRLPEWTDEARGSDQASGLNNLNVGELELLLSDAWAWARARTDDWDWMRQLSTRTRFSGGSSLRNSSDAGGRNGDYQDVSRQSDQPHVIYDGDEEGEAEGTERGYDASSNAGRSASGSASRTTEQSGDGEQFVIE